MPSPEEPRLRVQEGAGVHSLPPPPLRPLSPDGGVIGGRSVAPHPAPSVVDVAVAQPQILPSSKETQNMHTHWFGLQGSSPPPEKM